jgi:putative membrane protein
MLHLYSSDMTGWKEVLLVFTGVILWVMIVGGVLAEFRDSRPTPGWGRRSLEEDLLFERFARGEIDDDEYRHHRERLRRPLPTPETPVIIISREE